MAARSLRRPLGLATAAIAAVLTAGLAAALAPPEPAGAKPAASAATGLEDVVGPIDPAVRAQLPADPKIWGPYALRGTPDDCRGGAGSCVQKTISSMRARFDRLAPTCDHDAVFSLLYLRVTEYYAQVVARPGYFADPRTVNYEDRVFYLLYDGSYADWHAGRPLSVPPVWRLAYAAADARQVSGSGDAMLGMAGHILRDLPFTLWRVAKVGYGDHVKVNQMLREVYSSVIEEISRRFDPTMAVYDPVPGTGGLVLVDAVAQWREKAWRGGQALLAARDRASWEAEAQRIEREAWATALAIYLGTRYPVQELTVTRDSYCATHWNS